MRSPRPTSHGRAATEALARLDVFAGEWEAEGVTAAGETFRASDSYEWIARGHFMLHRFDADMPDGRMQGIEVIGYDASLVVRRLA